MTHPKPDLQAIGLLVAQALMGRFLCVSALLLALLGVQCARDDPNSAIRQDATTSLDSSPSKDVDTGEDAHDHSDATPETDASYLADHPGLPDSLPNDAPLHDARSSDAGLVDGSAMRDAGSSSTATPWRLAVSSCFSDPACRRALIVSHGGDWDVDHPYNSRAAFEQAYACGADAIETDIRVTRDGVPVLVHSSPIPFYESRDCANRRVEDMTADEATACHLALSQTHTVQRLDDVLRWSQGKIIIELDVKETRDLARTIEVLFEHRAEDRAYVAVTTDEIATTVPTIAQWGRAHYSIRVRSAASAVQQAASAPRPEVFMLELDRSFDDADEAAVSALIAQAIHPQGLKAMTKSDQRFATRRNHLEVYRQGFDVVLSYGCSNGVLARNEINHERGL